MVITLLPALPELAIRSTISDSLNHSVCILNTDHHSYALYVSLKIVVRHLLPALCVLLSILRPTTVVAKRISLIFTGQPGVCECGPSGSVRTTPHECPKMTRSRPDILRDTEVTDMITGQAKKDKNSIPALLEDPVRRTYKKFLAISFLVTSFVYILVDLSFQVLL